ncbi:uncharacterized protein LACBIDRAFT_322603 [Laccaria bicolor S238N-H82]|uniref:Predicted protein n=1 Tax=Laccaria bicolor (strain S238N-H82 / ATCC MYA-4686) TaxID=486041 RepID=B0CWW7_LACBS|nr:uncharacterized protein LACBIDRAFT_322603 [Laccaria bicolor S238N-H82]EDR13143.1 predicted protein [Laccaria bicolor S238N-H82]|eukprot:XP_001875641.1 predicted protein [Laccaria bicolor S238N-H82]
MAMACHIVHDDTPCHSLHIAYGPLPLLNIHTHLGTCTPTNHNGNNERLLGQQCMEKTMWHLNDPLGMCHVIQTAMTVCVGQDDAKNGVTTDNNKDIPEDVRDTSSELEGSGSHGSDDGSDSDSSSSLMASSQPHSYANHLMDHILLLKSARDKMAAPKANGHTPPKKKKKAAITMAKPVFAIAAETKAKNITYNLVIFPTSECMKELKKRAGTNTFMKLEEEEPFDTWKAQLLVCIDKTLTPTVLDFANYETTFTVPHISTAPMAISCDEEYTDMLECIRRTKDLVCAVFVQEHQQMLSSKKHEKENIPKENEDENMEDE